MTSTYGLGCVLMEETKRVNLLSYAGNSVVSAAVNSYSSFSTITLLLCIAEAITFIAFMSLNINFLC